MTKKYKAALATAALKRLYPGAVCSLAYDDPFRLLVAVRLSAQCTDERVNRVTPALFEKYPTVKAFAEAELPELESLIYSCGFYRSKAADIKEAARQVLEDFGGVVPGDMDSLLSLRGVGRKSANLLLGDLYGQPAVVADTHCIRISNRLGLCDSRDPYKVELALREILKPEESGGFCHRIVLFGRDVCTARNPRCGICPLRVLCDYVKKDGSET